MIRNEYEYTQEACKEILGIWFNKQFQSNRVAVYTIAIASLILFLTDGSKAYLYLLGISLIGIIILVMKKRQTIKMERERMEVLYKKVSPMITVELADRIHLKAAGTERYIDYSDIARVVKGKNYIVLFIRGSFTIALKNDGYIEGTYEEALALLGQ